MTIGSEQPAVEGDKPSEYDAFLSYAHRDRDVTTAIQKGLHQIGRRVRQLRALRVFRDDTNLTASPDLWGKITDALDSLGGQHHDHEARATLAASCHSTG